MNTDVSPPPGLPPPVREWYFFPTGPEVPYLAVAYLSLGGIFLAQMQQGLFLSNLLVVACGAIGLVGRWQRGPLILLWVVAAAQLLHQAWLNRFQDFSRPRLLDAGDVILCMGVLGYVVAHYRLQAVWKHLLVPDPRRRTGPPPRSFRLFRKTSLETQKRPATQMTQPEVAFLVLSLPIWALLAQLWLTLFTLPGDFLELPQRWVHVLLLIWALGTGTFAVTSFLGLWKWRQLGRTAARLFLQDTTWRETRGEQRRLERWLAWKKIQQSENT